MSLVKLDPKAENRPHLPTAGEYGAGKNGFDVELTKFECPAEDRLPPWDQDGERGPYAYFGFQAKSDEAGIVFYDHWEEIGANTGSRTEKWVRQLGVEVENHTFDPADVAPRKVIIEVADPKDSKEGDRTYSGRLKNVVGV